MNCDLTLLSSCSAKKRSLEAAEEAAAEAEDFEAAANLSAEQDSLAQRMAQLERQVSAFPSHLHCVC